MSLFRLMQKNEKLAIGLMSGTSADGVDAALVKIKGCKEQTRVELVAFSSLEFPVQVRREVLDIASGKTANSQRICLLHALLGNLYLQACRDVCQKAGVQLYEIDLIGSHGQTIHHQPTAINYLGYPIAATLQIGEPSLLCEEVGAVVVSDFRVRDMAAGGQGAPLVPYTEYLLYKDNSCDIALQNIGGIGNITFLAKNATLANTIAFDTGPGNMLMDIAASRLTAGKNQYDPGGKLAAGFEVCKPLHALLMQDEYLYKQPPKTTGREYYGTAFVQNVYRMASETNASPGQVLRTLTRYTASTIAFSVQELLPSLPQKLIVGGGGSHNKTLLSDLQSLLPGVKVLTQEDLGYSSDAKEAIAFAVLANEAVHGICNNAPRATGAKHPVVMGKISQ